MFEKAAEESLLIIDTNFTIPDLWKSPRGGLWHIGFEFAVKNNKFLQPGSKNKKRQFPPVF